MSLVAVAYNVGVPQREPDSEHPPVDPAIIGLIVIAVVLFVFFAVRYSRVIPWSAR